MDYSQVYRIITLVVLLTTWYVISKRTTERWEYLTRLGRRLWLGYYTILFSLVWGTLDQLQADAPITSKNYVFLLSALCLMVAGLLRLSGDESTDPVYKINFNRNPLKFRIRKLR